MSTLTDAAKALRFLEGVENGSISSQTAFETVEKIDTVYTCIATKFLREKYPARNPESKAVVERLVDISSHYPQFVKLCQKGEKDVVVEWFNDTYQMREFFKNPEGLMQLIEEKMEG